MIRPVEVCTPGSFLNVFYMATHWVITNPHSQVSMEYQKGHGWIYVKWDGHISAENVVEVAEKYLTLQASVQCPKLLNDKREVTGDWAEANDWLQYEWLPKVQENGLRYFALVIPRHLLELATARDLERRFSHTLKVRLFYDVGTAERWLDSFPTAPSQNQKVN
ncbi:hypothetical protein [Rufibacter soli]